MKKESSVVKMSRREHKEFQKHNYKRNASIKGPVQEMPNYIVKEWQGGNPF